MPTRLRVGNDQQAADVDEGRHRLEAATPTVRALEHSIEADFTADEIAIVKRRLVESAVRTERPDATRRV